MPLIAEDLIQAADALTAWFESQDIRPGASIVIMLLVMRDAMAEVKASDKENKFKDLEEFVSQIAHKGFRDF